MLPRAAYYVSLYKGLILRCQLDESYAGLYGEGFTFGASIMFACGEDSLTDGAAFIGCTGDNHQPLFDARASAHKLVRLIREKKLVLP